MLAIGDLFPGLGSFVVNHFCYQTLESLPSLLPLKVAKRRLFEKVSLEHCYVKNWNNFLLVAIIVPEINSPIINYFVYFYFVFQVPFKCCISTELENDLLSIPVASVSHSAHKVPCIYKVDMYAL